MIKRLVAAVAFVALISTLSVGAPASAGQVVTSSNRLTSKSLIVATKNVDFALAKRQLSSSVAEPIQVRPLGANWFALKFSPAIDQSSVDEALAAYRADSLVRIAEYDLPLRPVVATSPSFRSSRSAAKPVIRAAALTPASAVTGLKVVNAFDQSNPTLARLSLTWAAPAKLYGAVVTAYEVDFRQTGSTWQVASQNSNAKSLTISSGLVAGTPYQFRVRALTKLGSSTAVGAYSSVFSATPTTAPIAPVLTTAATITKNSTIRWRPQTRDARGGLAVTYTATATASGQTQLTCTTSSTGCAIKGVVTGNTYQVSVTATNTLGSATSSASFVPRDALYGQQWYLNSQYGIKADKAWQTTMGSPSVVVAVMDSGITQHPDLNSQTVQGYDFVSDPASSNDGNGWDPDPSDPGDYGQYDSSWHGTHVAGLIAAAANSIGVIGVAPFVKIQPVRVLGSQGGQTSDLIAALHWAAGIHVAGVPDNKTPAKVINMSMGTDSYSVCDTGTANAVQDVLNKGVTMLTAAGNYSTDAFGSYPGNCYGTINIGATGYTGDISSYSDFGLGVDISAPGGDSQNPGNAPVASNGAILSTINTGKTVPGAPDYAYEEGTSMATPLVAGVVALMYSVNPNITPAQVWDGLRTTASPFLPGSLCALTVGHTDRNLYSRSQLQRCGAGIVNAEGAVQFALTTK